MSVPSAAKAPATPAKSKSLFGKQSDRDRTTMRLILGRALSDARQSLEADPYLRRTIAAAEETGNLRKAYIEIDNYIAQAVDFYLRNRPSNEKIRARSVSCVSATDLSKRQARCIVTVFAWGHMRREIIDLELPQP